MHRDAFDIAETWGKDTFVMIDKLGTDKMPLVLHAQGTDRCAAGSRQVAEAPR